MNIKLIITLAISAVLTVYIAYRMVSTEIESPYRDVNDVETSLPLGFKFPETRELSIKAFDLHGKGRYAESIDLYDQARGLEPENLKILFDQANSYAQSGDLETAITLLNRAIELNQNYAAFYNNRGLLKYKLSMNFEALQDFESAIAIDSLSISSHSNMALTYYYLGEYEKSCESIVKARELGLTFKNRPFLKKIYQTKCKM